MFIAAGCFGNDDDDSKEVLDLRIKKNGNPVPLQSVTEVGEPKADGSVQSTHVKIEAAAGGILFTITKPSDSTYGDGFGYVAIYRIENDVQTTCCVLPWGASSYEPFIYPFCESGETYRFKVQIESTHSNDNGRVDQYHEYLTIKATDGIGDIDYSNINSRDWLSASQSGDDALVSLSDCIPPDANSVKTTIQYFVGDGDFDKASTKYLSTYNATKIEFDRREPGLIETVKSKGASQFFAEYFFSFKLDAYPQFADIKTKTLRSNIVTIK